MEIRLATAAEHAAVGELTLAAYAPYLSAADAGYATSLRDAAGRARHADLWVAVDDGELVGTVTDPPPGSPYRELAGPDEGEFRMLAVAPRAQGRGVGAALVRHVVERSRAAGRRTIVISSLPGMAAAHRIYDRFGFTRAPELDWAPEPDVPLIAFRLDLEQP